MIAHSGPHRVLFRVAAGARTGFGHLVRATSLASALGVRPVLSIRGARSGAAAARRLGARVANPGTAMRVLEETRADVLVIDDRVASATLTWRRAARRLGIFIVSIHDLGIGVGDADLIVDASVDAAGRGGKACRTLLGPRFAILNPRCVDRRRGTGPELGPDRIVIALGGGPRRQVALRLALLIVCLRPDLRVSVAGGFVASDCRTRVNGLRWVSPSSFGASLAAATVAVVGGGVTLYEAAALGVPTVALAVVASQRPTVEAFAARGAAADGGLLTAGSERARVLGALSRQVKSLVEDAAARRRLSRRAGRLVDRSGASRVAKVIREMLAARETGGGTMIRRAIVFDLDETLYRERRFALGGYRAVGRSVCEQFGIREQAAFTFLALALRQGRRARAFQHLCEHYGLPSSCIPSWIETYRTHEPRLRLHAPARRALETLGGTWRIGVLTNGLPAVQASKVRALGIDKLVDAVVYADDFGGGKPGAAAFLEVLARLGAEPRNSVFAGDDPVRDIEGARQVGMRTVLVARGPDDGGDSGVAADAVVRSLTEVPVVANRLVSGESQHVH